MRNCIAKGTITAVGGVAHLEAILSDRYNKQAILKSCASFTDCITRVNNTSVGNECKRS